MPKKVTPHQRQAMLQMLAQGEDRDTIAAAVGVTPGQVSAIAAHVKMGTYAMPAAEDSSPVTGDTCSRASASSASAAHDSASAGPQPGALQGLGLRRQRHRFALGRIAATSRGTRRSSGQTYDALPDRVSLPVLDNGGRLAAIAEVEAANLPSTRGQLPVSSRESSVETEHSTSEPA